jgi:hypothetical protein
MVASSMNNQTLLPKQILAALNKNELRAGSGEEVCSAENHARLENGEVYDNL